MLLERALCRPQNYDDLSAAKQWQIDKDLGILDWSPTPEETKEYIRRRREQANRGKDVRLRNS